MKLFSHRFGGDWTTKKLERLRKYLAAYVKIMSKQHFTFAYIDAFAGTGYRTLKTPENTGELLFPELAAQDSQRFLDGSARIALQVEPHFDKYIFIEKDDNKIVELEKIKDEFPTVRDRIDIVNEEANKYIIGLCARNWEKHRAVMFLDPFGMQVTWPTIKAVGDTQAIDLWLLFPLGIAVNRLLKRDGNIDENWKQKLDDIFGESSWYDAFYQTISTRDLFGEVSQIQKTGNFESIGSYFVNRLKTVFVDVAKNPLPLCNSKNIPLFLLCFACANPKGAKTAIKIAQDILKP
ncbi:MAG: three-Cys-motif partner protein TcmP [Gammaproteobacteria bacterium]|nr:MAG: three-Cys-motif partner protein TcmP [Gammaproteobacteria bacterium]